MKPVIFSDPWKDALFNLRNASKILLHFHTIYKLSELRDGQSNDSLFALDDRLTEEEVQLIYGDSADIAASLVTYSNDILSFYTDSGVDFTDGFEHNKVEELAGVYEKKARDFDFLVHWCLPARELTASDYDFFVNEIINERVNVPFSSYVVLRSLKYDEFLKTRYWIAVSKRVREINGKCQECGSTNNLQVHHLTYDNHGMEHRHLDDLKCLCKDCHLKAHHELNKKK